ncbi:MAG: hypothetical protein SVV03_00205, partial [Candidatus Nanohaloarchaea archaeon]|nr:hypothetical protein [Candidatus Nanohaloarchaea archaeon]
ADSQNPENLVNVEMVEGSLDNWKVGEARNVRFKVSLTSQTEGKYTLNGADLNLYLIPERIETRQCSGSASQCFIPQSDGGVAVTPDSTKDKLQVQVKNENGKEVYSEIINPDIRENQIETNSIYFWDTGNQETLVEAAARESATYQMEGLSVTGYFAARGSGDRKIVVRNEETGEKIERRDDEPFLPVHARGVTWGVHQNGVHKIDGTGEERKTTFTVKIVDPYSMGGAEVEEERKFTFKAGRVQAGKNTPVKWSISPKPQEFPWDKDKVDIKVTAETEGENLAGLRIWNDINHEGSAAVDPDPTFKNDFKYECAREAEYGSNPYRTKCSNTFTHEPILDYMSSYEIIAKLQKCGGSGECEWKTLDKKKWTDFSP